MGLNKLIKSGANERHSLLTYKICSVPLFWNYVLRGLRPSEFLYRCVLYLFLWDYVFQVLSRNRKWWMRLVASWRSALSLLTISLKTHCAIFFMGLKASHTFRIVTGFFLFIPQRNSSIHRPLAALLVFQRRLNDQPIWYAKRHTQFSLLSLFHSIKLWRQV